MGSTWDPEQYLRFREQRRQPYEDLVALIEPRPGMRLVDLGCGPGELTVDLAARLEATEAVGIDSSETMLARAPDPAPAGVRFERADVARHPLGSGLDLVFSNAALHWLPDHPRLFERLRDALGPAGQLAVHMPANFEQPTHTIAAELAGEDPYRRALEGQTAGAAIDGPEAYATLLYDLGFARQVVRQAIYLHEVPGPEAVVEWVKGSMLTWYQARLQPERFAAFSTEYERRLLARLPSRRPYPFTYRRLLMWAARGR